MFTKINRPGKPKKTKNLKLIHFNLHKISDLFIKQLNRQSIVFPSLASLGGGLYPALVFWLK